jgi:hypothetical protein
VKILNFVSMVNAGRCGYLLLLLLAASVRCQSSNRRALDSVPPVTESLQYFSRELYKVIARLLASGYRPSTT